MFLELSHTKLDIFKVSKNLILNCYKETKAFPPEEKFGIVQQIRRVAVSGHLNIAEGCSGKSKTERKRFYEVARGSLIEVDTALDVSVDLNYTAREKLVELGQLIVRLFQMISKMIS
jgi:four helix bundle protein